MSRLTIRLRLTIAFAAAVVLVLVGAGMFVYLRLRADLDDGIDGNLRARVAAAITLVTSDGPAAMARSPLADAEEFFAQVLATTGPVLAQVGSVRGTALTASELAATTAGDVHVERSVPGIDGTARILARRVPGAASLTVVVGQSLADRDDTLNDVRNSFALGGPLAVLAASLAGYWLARLGLRPMDDMRRTAADISARRAGQRLPLPVAHDEVRRLGETLNDMLDRLERSFERERRFVSDASHELRTPIAVAKTGFEGALRTGDYGPDVGDALRAAIDECDGLAQLADDLLVVARTDEHGLDLLVEPLPLGELVDTVRDRFIDRATSHGRTIVVDTNGDPTVLGDRLRLRQALGNLVDNAVRHGTGVITITTGQHGHEAFVDIADAGQGFSADLAGRAFDRFARGDQARTRSGAGLGLAIVRTIAEAHGGSASIVGPSTVRLTLPTATP